MSLIKRICLIISLLTLWQGSLSAQMFSTQRNSEIEANVLYNETVYILSNYSGTSASQETMSIDELLERNVESFYFYIRKDTISNALMLRNPGGTYTPFSEALVAVKKALTDDSKRVITLFLDYVVEADMTQAFSEIGLLDNVYELDSRTGWPTLKSMVETDKRLVVFEVQHHLSSPSWLHNLSDYVANVDAEWGNGTVAVESFDERLKKSLSVFTNLKYIESNRGEEEVYDMARYSPYIIESYKREWTRNGMMPNFVLVSRYYSWLNSTLLTLRNFCIVSGIVTYNGELMNYVNWEGLSNSTSGKFSFPLEQGAEMTLAPSSPGYQLAPEKIKVEANGGKRIFVGEIKAKPLIISRDLEINLPLNGSAKDESRNGYPTVAEGVEFGLDPMRGDVASFEKQARISLPVSSELGMRDHDFTVGVWLKIPKYLADKSDYCVLGSKGSNNSYQQALHLIIRNRKPYMGFFNNDLHGNTEIEPGKWYHVVWRYNKSNGEQAIFVNGKLDAISVERPSYLGNDSLYVGYVDFSRTASFEGNLSSLNIWSRVLSDKEILALNNQLLDLNATEPWPFRNWLIGGLVLLLLVSSAFAFWFYRKHKKEQKESVILPTGPDVLVQEKAAEQPMPKNSIFLFGEFMVIDKDGEDITSLFTPKIKQLFLYILLNSSRGGQGVSGADLADNIWGETEGKKIKSLRSVSILKLRKILERLDKMEVMFSGNHYALQVSESLSCDYLQYLDMLREKRVNSKKEFEKFYRIIRRGEVFEGLSFGWMDDYKSYVCNSSVDVMSQFIESYSIGQEPDRVIEIAERILVNDPSNEEALEYKVKALIAHNNFRQARYAYDRFASLYNSMYGEPYGRAFEEISGENKD